MLSEFLSNYFYQLEFDSKEIRGITRTYEYVPN